MTEKKCANILIGVLALCAVLGITTLSGFRGVLDLSDGLGFGNGGIEGRRQIYQVKYRLHNGQFLIAGRQALEGIRLLLDSEIRWNSARFHLDRSRNLCQLEMYTEAYDACRTAGELLIGYNGSTYDPGLIHGECLLIWYEHGCNTDSIYSSEEP